MSARRWFVLGFDCDDIVGAWQDWRLARQCVATLTAAHRAPMNGILESAGQGRHLTYWYLRDDVAGILDDVVENLDIFRFIGRAGQEAVRARPPADQDAVARDIVDVVVRDHDVA